MDNENTLAESQKRGNDKAELIEVISKPNEKLEVIRPNQSSDSIPTLKNYEKTSNSKRHLDEPITDTCKVEMSSDKPLKTISSVCDSKVESIQKLGVCFPDDILSLSRNDGGANTFTESAIIPLTGISGSSCTYDKFKLLEYAKESEEGKSKQAESSNLPFLENDTKINISKNSSIENLQGSTSKEAACGDNIPSPVAKVKGEDVIEEFEISNKSLVPDLCIKGSSGDLSDLQLSENAQLPSFSTLKDSDQSTTIPTLSESLKIAVSADICFSEKMSEGCMVESSAVNNGTKQNQTYPVFVDTPAESCTDTPYESRETSPTISTPLDSCHVSAATSPLPKDDPTIALPEVEDNLPVNKEEEPSVVTRIKNIPEIQRVSKRKYPFILDEDTRMSANGNLTTDDFQVDEDSLSSLGVITKKKVRSFRCEVIVPESTEVFTADKVVEYMWPLDNQGEHYFIQEHIARYLSITSFKRKYPDIRRRPIESQEKEYLKELGIVSEMACDLGLTAVRSDEVLDVLFNDFPAKYEELQKILRERKEKQLKEKGKVSYQVATLDKSKMQEYSRKAALSALRWNIGFNRERREERRYAFDLQTFTLHHPIRNRKRNPEASKMGSYPIAVLPGQYTDYNKKYACQEINCMPLQTVLSGPFTAEELAAADPQGIESDDESAAASVSTYTDIKEEIVSLDIETPSAPILVVDPLSAERQPRCKVCNGGRDRNKDGKPEPLIICGSCRSASHPTCVDLNVNMVGKIESYSWQCMDCKMCVQCNDPDDEEKMIFCDMCDRGYHIYCVGLRKVPNGRWHCKECAVCFTCGARNPSGNEHIKNAEWQHEFKKDKDNKQLKYTCTLCMPCDKYWKRRQFCHVCIKVYRSIPEDGMVRCVGCPKYVHKDGCSLLVDNERFCNICYKSRNKTALNHSRIIAAAKKKMASGY